MQETKLRYWLIIINQTLCTKSFTKNNVILSLYLTYIWMQNLETRTNNRLPKNLIKLLEKALQIINFKNFNENVNPLFKENQILKVSNFIAYKNALSVRNYSNLKLNLKIFWIHQINLHFMVKAHFQLKEQTNGICFNE